LITFFDRRGAPIAYTDDDQYIYYFNGKPVAHIDGNSIYSFSGRHLGWYIDGWIIDHIGGHVLFTVNASGGPLTPLPALEPLPALPALSPLPALPQLPPLEPLRRLAWSEISGKQFFER